MKSAGDYFDCDLSFSATVGTDYAIAVNATTDGGGPFALRLRYPGPATTHSAAAPVTAARTRATTLWRRRNRASRNTAYGRAVHPSVPLGRPDARHGDRDSVGSTFDTLLAAYMGTTLTVR